MYYSDIGIFDNSHTRMRAPEFMVGNYCEVEYFNNGVAKSKVAQIFGDVGTVNVFDNSIMAQFKRTVLVVGYTTPTTIFNNSIAVAKNPIYIMNWSMVNSFNNNISLLTNTHITFLVGKTTEEAWFNNAYYGGFVHKIGEWSLGVFDLPNNIPLLMYDEYNFDAVKEDLLWPTLTYNWYDNNVPSKGKPIQFRNIAMGYVKDNIQFSINMPKESVEVQVDAGYIEKSENLEVCTYATPPIDGEDVIEVQAEVELDKYHLEMQVRPGYRLGRILEVQMESLKDRIERLDHQVIIGYDSTESMELQNTMVYKSWDSVELQATVPSIYKDESVEQQVKVVHYAADSMEIQNEVLADRIEKLHIQSKVEVEVDEVIDNQVVIGFPDDSSMELQNEVYTAKWDTLDMQVNKDGNVAVKNIDVQWFATPPIDTDKVLDTQFKVDYTNNWDMEIQSNVDRYIQYVGVEQQWVQSAAWDSTVDMSFATVIEAKTRMQGHVVPWGYDNTAAQYMLYPTMKSMLEITFDMTVTKEYPLEVQGMLQITDESSIEVCADTSIEHDEMLEVCVDASEISKDESLEVQYVLKETIEDILEVCASTTIDMDSMLELQQDTTIVSDEILDIQYNVSSIYKDYGVEYQWNIDEITKDEKLEVEFDILDLVYYMTYSGYNLVPWWSDGKGSWNPDVDKNWDKEDEGDTMADNLVAQLNDIELDAEVRDMVDIGTKNFMFYRELLNVTLNNKVIKLVNAGTTKKYLTLGKSKRDKTDTIELKKGNNVVFYDGREEMFNPAIRDSIDEYIEHTLIWKPQIGEWERFTGDTAVYFYEDIDGKDMPMPYVFIIAVNDDCTIDVKR